MHLKYRKPLFPENIHEYFRDIFLLQEEIGEQIQDFKIMNRNL